MNKTFITICAIIICIPLLGIIYNAAQGQVLPLKDMEKIFRIKYFKYVRSISSSDSSAAEKLGMAPSNFYRMCKELGIK